MTTHPSEDHRAAVWELFHENRVRDALERERPELALRAQRMEDLEGVREYFRETIQRLGAETLRQEALLHRAMEREGVRHWYKGRYRRAIHAVVKTYPLGGEGDHGDLWELEYITWTLLHGTEFTSVREKIDLLAKRSHTA